MEKITNENGYYFGVENDDYNWNDVFDDDDVYIGSYDTDDFLFKADGLSVYDIENLNTLLPILVTYII